MKASLALSQEFDTFQCGNCGVEFMWFAVIRLDEYGEQSVDIWPTEKARGCPSCGVALYDPAQAEGE